MTAKEMRKKFGLLGHALQGHRVLGREMGHNFTVPSFCVIVVDTEQGVATGANVYGGNLGKGYDPQFYTTPVTGESQKTWDGKGYVEWTAEEVESRLCGAVELLTSKVEAKPKAAKAAK